MKAWLFLAALLALDETRGDKLYRGPAELTARMAGGGDELAPVAARCVNCHGADGRGVREAGIEGSDIRQFKLTQSTRRRGGPPSSYSLTAFCGTLQTGVDPAGVVLDRAMPRYTLAAGDCSALWKRLGSFPR